MYKFWTVIEIQEGNDSKMSTLAAAYGDYAKAESAYYAILSAAAISDMPYHAAYIIDDETGVCEMRIFDRRMKK